MFGWLTRYLRGIPQDIYTTVSYKIPVGNKDAMQILWLRKNRKRRQS